MLQNGFTFQIKSSYTDLWSGRDFKSKGIAGAKLGKALDFYRRETVSVKLQINDCNI
jgi:hypothetical protein